MPIEMDSRAVSTLALYGVKGAALQEIVDCWNQPHRHYHTMEHLNYLVVAIHEHQGWKQHEKHLLTLAAVFHDVVYDVAAKDNEERSAVFFTISVAKKYIQDEDRQLVKDMIMATADHTKESASHIVNFFSKLDLYPLLDFDIPQLVRYEDQIFKEYQRHNIRDYIAGRLEVLCKFGSWLVETGRDVECIEWLISYVKHRPYHIGVYAGSFAPFHSGHLDILRQAEAQCDKVIVGVGFNPDKWTAQSGENFDALKSYLFDREVCRYHCMLTDFAWAQTYDMPNVKVTIYRGLRDGDDLSYETKQLRFMQELAMEEFNVAFIVGDSKYSHISSSSIKNLRNFLPAQADRYLLYPFKP